MGEPDAAEEGGAVKCRVPATGIQKQLPLARLKPAVGEMFRQAHRKPRGLDYCASRPDPKTHNRSEAQVRQQVIGLRRDFLSTSSSQTVTGIVTTNRRRP
jgi:hypothetical protein